MADTYDFPYHVLETQYPKSSTTISFGRGYEFASAPDGPDQVTYILHYPGMWYFLKADGSYDLSTNPKVNARVLEEFYQAHRLYEPFVFPHPAEGDITVRFAEPLALKLVEDGHGLVQPFEIKLRTQP